MTRDCTVCHKSWGFGSRPFFFALRASALEAPEEVFVCEDCHSRIDAGDLPFSRVHAPGYAVPAQERRFWHNETPLPVDKAFDPVHMPLENYPLIHDFEVLVLCWTYPPGTGNTAWHACVRLMSLSQGYLTYILPVDFDSPDVTVPQGNFDHSYSFEGGTDSLDTRIATQDEFVYILTDNEEFLPGVYEDRTRSYPAWFKVEKRLYDTHWRQAVFFTRSLSRPSE